MRQNRSHKKHYLLGFFLSLFFMLHAQPEVLLTKGPEETLATRSLALKTNVLLDAAMIPSLGVELALPQQWSVAGNWMYARWGRASRNRCWHIYGGEVELRKWIGFKNREQALIGHHVGY